MRREYRKSRDPLRKRRSSRFGFKLKMDLPFLDSHYSHSRGCSARYVMHCLLPYINSNYSFCNQGSTLSRQPGTARATPLAQTPHNAASVYSLPPPSQPRQLISARAERLTPDAPNDDEDALTVGGGAQVPHVWPNFTDLVLSPTGRWPGIAPQSSQVHSLLTETNTQQTPFLLCWHYAFPPPGQYRAQVMRAALIRAAIVLNQTEIHDRLRAEKDYADILGSSVRFQADFGIESLGIR